MFNIESIADVVVVFLEEKIFLFHVDQHILIVGTAISISISIFVFVSTVQRASQVAQTAPSGVKRIEWKECSLF